MAKGFFTGRSRANTTTEQRADAISRPTLTFTDAQPRADLQALGAITSTLPTNDEGLVTAFRTESERPRTAGGSWKSKSREKPRPELTTAQTFGPTMSSITPQAFSQSAQVANPPSEGFVIGMALGSPSQAGWPLQNHLGQSIAQSPLMHSEDNAEDSQDAMAEQLLRKSSKWKKFGDLFKAKNAVAPGPNTPFYSLQSQYTAHVSPQLEKPLPSQPTDNIPKYVPLIIPDKVERVTGMHDSTGGVSSSRNGWEAMQTSAESSRSGSGLKGQISHGGSPAFLKHDPMTDKPSFLLNDGGPLLNVDIPDVQMERYSVMFGSLLGKSSSNLLERRSKMLDKLKTIADEEEKTKLFNGLEAPDDSHSPSMNLPDDQRLKPRRATSPSFQKSPSFSLFPVTANKAENPAGPFAHERNSPLQRSHTAPAGSVSPRRELFDGPKPQVKIDPVATVESPAQTTSSTTHGQKWSSDSSYLSPSSSRSSLGEEIIFDMKPLQQLNEGDEQQWEMVTQEKPVDIAPLRPKHKKSEPAMSPVWEVTKPKETKAEPLKSPKVKTDDATLAALERPLPKAQDIANFEATKSRIDRIMSPKSVEKPKTTLSEERSEHVLASKIPRKTSQNLKELGAEASLKKSTPVVPTSSANTGRDPGKDDPSGQAANTSPIVYTARKRAASRATPSKEDRHQVPNPTVRDPQVIREARDRALGLPSRPKIHFNDDGTIIKDDFTESRAVRAAKKQAALRLTNPKSGETLPTASPQPSSPPEESVDKRMKTSADLTSMSTAESTKALADFAMMSKGSPSSSSTSSTEKQQHHHHYLQQNTVRVASPAPTTAMTAAQVSIARQISISKRQRGELPQQLLVPIHKTDHLREDEKVVDRQPLMPQIVDVHRGHRPGKSQNIVIESA